VEEEAVKYGKMRRKWSRGDKLAVGGVLLAAVAAVAAWLVVPEFRLFFHLDRPQTTQAETKPTQSVVPPTPVQAEPAKPEPSKPETSKPKKARPSQKTTAHVSGNDNVAGNNVAGDHNVTGNNNRTEPIAIAPNGIAIAGGTVTNPTVNNYAPTPPHVTWKMTTNEKGTVVTINSDKMFSNALFTVTCDSPCKYASMSMGVYAMMSTDRQVNDRTWEFGVSQFNPAGTLEIQFSGDPGFKIMEVATRF
jgi:cytoskeletal protein RodZ